MMKKGTRLSGNPDVHSFSIGIMGSAYTLFADKFFNWLFQGEQNSSFWVTICTFSLLAGTIFIYYFYCCRKSAQPPNPSTPAKTTAQEINERLCTLRTLKGKKAISSDEYKQLREKILNEI